MEVGRSRHGKNSLAPKVSSAISTVSLTLGNQDMIGIEYGKVCNEERLLLNQTLSQKEYLANKENFPVLASQDKERRVDDDILGNRRRSDLVKQLDQFFESLDKIQDDKDREDYPEILGDISNNIQQVCSQSS